MARNLDPRSREARLEEVRRQNEADARRARTLGVAAAVVVGLLVLAVVVAVLLSLRGGDEDAAGGDVTYPEGTVLTVPDDPASGGFPVGGDVAAVEDAEVRVLVLEDYQCPACQAFEAESGALLAELAATDDVAVLRRPVAILDRLTGDGVYSTRSAAAAACVGSTAGGESLDAFSAALFAEQPPEQDAGTGLSDERLVELAVEAGADPDAVTACVTGGTFVPWAAATTASAGEQLDRLATPTVLVDGEVVTGAAGGYPSGAELQAAVDAARTEG